MDAKQKTETATLAGGCFWCLQPPFEDLSGVISATCGYAGGREANPAYEQVACGKTGHLEAVQIVFDPQEVSYRELLDVFWRQIDPTDPGGQFADRGRQYQTAIFYHDEKQRLLAEQSKESLSASGRFDRPIATRIEPYTTFYPAEDYHQRYHARNPERYQAYHRGSGRQGYLRRVWGRSGPDLLRRLTPLQYRVTQENATEPPFRNQYWDHHEEGIYVDVVSGEALFSSTDKFDSGSGWPAFTRPLEPANIVERRDASLGMRRTEVRSLQADSHLGHLFDDGPPPTGKRYCINSAALRFVPKQHLEQEGYRRYSKLFAE